MFSSDMKYMIAEKVQQILQDTRHCELPEGQIDFLLHVDGKESWSWANIRNNGATQQDALPVVRENLKGGVMPHEIDFFEKRYNLVRSTFDINRVYFERAAIALDEMHKESDDPLVKKALIDAAGRIRLAVGTIGKACGYEKT